MKVVFYLFIFISVVAYSVFTYRVVLGSGHRKMPGQKFLILSPYLTLLGNFFFFLNVPVDLLPSEILISPVWGRA